MKLIESLGTLVLPDSYLKKSFEYRLFYVGCNEHYWDGAKPYQQRNSLNNGARLWHHDTKGASGSAWEASIMWCNIMPTEILLPTGEIYTPEPNEVFVVSNKIVRHRTPAEFIKLLESDSVVPDRYLSRRLVATVPSDDTLNTWRRAVEQKQKDINRTSMQDVFA